MNRLSSFLLVLLASATMATAARPTPVPYIYVNDSPLDFPTLPPQLDASIFLNNSLFSVTYDFDFDGFNDRLVPYSGQSVRYWTNHGEMNADGFIFNYIPNPAHLNGLQRQRRGWNLPQPSEVFHNDGHITVVTLLEVNAKKIENPGVLSGDYWSRIRLQSTNGLADLSRGIVRTGPLELPDCVVQTNFFNFGPFIFLEDAQVNYRYLSSGVSGFVNTNRNPFFLNSLPFAFNLPNPQVPFSQYIEQVSTAPLTLPILVTNTLFSVENCGQYGAFTHVITNITTDAQSGRSITNLDVNVVFVPTNGLGSNVTVGVSFPTNFFGSFTLSPIVEFRAAEYDIIAQRVKTNYITFRDDGFSIFRGHDCNFDLGLPSNTPFTNDLFRGNFFSTNGNPVADYAYAVAYAKVGNTNSPYYTNSASQFFFFPELLPSPAVTDPTNYIGTVSVKARNLDMTMARIQGETGISIQASNLIGNLNTYLDAPFISLDASTTNRTMTISNMIHPTATRLQATLNSWSGVWSAPVVEGFRTNTTPTNIIITPIFASRTYQVTIIGTCMDSLQPTIVHRLNLQATNLVMEDSLAVSHSIRLVSDSLTFGSNFNLRLPQTHSLAFTNFIGATSLTNYGVLNVPRAAYFGALDEGYVVPPPTKVRRNAPQLPRLLTYKNFVNHNSVTGSVVSVRSQHLENTGGEGTRAVLSATNGAVRLNGAALILSNAVVQARNDTRLTAGSALLTRTSLAAGATNASTFSSSYLPGAIYIDATNSLSDGGVEAGNEWLSTSGIIISRRPAGPVGDFMGTRAAVMAGTFQTATIQWAGQNRGAVAAGFSNNLALGRLVLDGRLQNQFRFKGAGPNQAIYVEFLELLNDPANYNFSLNVDPDFTIFFADSNISPEKLNAISNGRVRWVRDFAGPRTSTTLTYPVNGQSYTFNSGLVRSEDIDSDGDGVANSVDCMPIPVPGLNTSNTVDCLPSVVVPSLAGAKAKSLSGGSDGLSLVVTRDTVGQVTLQWSSPASSVNVVEFTEAVTGSQWQVLTNYINGPVDARLTIKDATVAPLRVYRVRVDTGKP